MKLLNNLWKVMPDVGLEFERGGRLLSFSDPAGQAFVGSSPTDAIMQFTAAFETELGIQMIDLDGRVAEGASLFQRIEQQRVMGIPLVDAELQWIVDLGTNAVVSMSNRLDPNVEEAPEPEARLPESEITPYIVELLESHNLGGAEIVSTELAYYRHTSQSYLHDHSDAESAGLVEDIIPETGEIHLAYIVEVHLAPSGYRLELYLDAHSGTLLRVRPLT